MSADQDNAFDVIVLLMAVVIVLGAIALGCARPAEPEGVSDYRRCAAQCPEIFLLDFSTDPPTCDCTGIQC